MKKFKTFAAMLAAAALFASCSDSESNASYYIQLLKPRTGDTYISVRYANETADSLVFYSSSSWAISPYMNSAPWLKFSGPLSGNASQIVRYGVEMEPNTTGQVREAFYRISITNTSKDAYNTIAFQQMATRIDGTLGNAPLVKQISGSDGSLISIDYDAMSRPTHIALKGQKTELDMTIGYEKRGGTDNTTVATFTTNKHVFAYNDTTYTLNNLTTTGEFEDQSFAGVRNWVLMPQMFTSFKSADNASMRKQTSSGFDNYMPITHEGSYAAFSPDGLYGTSYENALMVNNVLGRFSTTYGVYYNSKCQLYADEKHTADSIAVVRLYSDYKRHYETYKLEFADIDARMNSVDVNQLIEGVDQCDPYMLLSFFKLARQTSVISKATGRYNTYTVATKQRLDKSVESMTVTDQHGNAITYTFSY